ncbi:hypothetical protein DQ04_00081240 [Trypanosoma grayi]|uniref:hypothetical protein n=1 Tax=Trypanosoma grayi TaxID=71804 RepID=UPI0004F43230|nr:hypothetical protein DQ04_00081240 [Trypanosoma grayi]KEG15425.1 hypothetical protein DQ04_00081240 [Trypanosoma grayi]
MSGDYRGRLIAFYSYYAPEKVGNVDGQLVKYEGREEHLLQALVNKYGPEPAESTENDGNEKNDNTDGDWDQYDWQTYYHQRLINYYSTYAPEKVESVERVLAKYAGREEELFEALVRKYGPELEYDGVDEENVEQDSVISSYRTRLLALYEAYAPARTGNVDAQLEKYRGREEELIAAVVKKYGPEPSEHGDAAADYRSRIVAIYERYAPDKLGKVDAQLEKYRGQEVALIEALERKYVHGTGSLASSLNASGCISPNAVTSEAAFHKTVLADAVIQLMKEETSARIEVADSSASPLSVVYWAAELAQRSFVELQEHIAFVALSEEFGRLLLVMEETVNHPTLVHPPFPFSGENECVVYSFFASLGTTKIGGELLIDSAVCRLLLAAAVCDDISPEPLEKVVSFERFRQLLTRGCLCEADAVAKMRGFLLTVNRRTRPQRLNPSRELRVGFWAHKCVRPCVMEKWDRVWVALDADTRLILRKPNAREPEMTIALSRVLKCRLASMLQTQAPRACAKNGLYLQLSVGPNPILLLLCPQRVEHAHALVRFFRRGLKAESTGAGGSSPSPERGAKEHNGGSCDDGKAARNPTCVLYATPVWCCRSGCSNYIRSFWLIVGDHIVHYAEGEQKRYSWSMTAVRDVYIANELAVKPPLGFARYGFVVSHDNGSLLCCAESAGARDALVDEMKRALFKLFLLSNNARLAPSTPLAVEERRSSDAPVPTTKQKVPGFIQ